MDPDSILMIVSDHGFTWNGGGYDHNPSSRTGYPDTSPPGVIILKGKGIRPGRIAGARLYDVTPTILYALREPIGEDMDGRALTEAFSEPLLFGRREERFVPTYGTGARQAEETSPPDAGEEEMLEDLRSLGYIR
jgi:arylsulfatase A-like enzyme